MTWTAIKNLDYYKRKTTLFIKIDQEIWRTEISQILEPKHTLQKRQLKQKVCYKSDFEVPQFLTKIVSSLFLMFWNKLLEICAIRNVSKFYLFSSDLQIGLTT